MLMLHRYRSCHGEVRRAAAARRRKRGFLEESKARRPGHQGRVKPVALVLGSCWSYPSAVIVRYM